MNTATEAPAPPGTKPAQNPRPDSDSEPSHQPPYAVILHNDHVNTALFVVETLQRVFGFSLEKAFELMQEAHYTGRSLIWSGMKEHAELKADQVRSRGADPTRRASGARPLRVSIEPLPQ
jgi:ATP-dependent Clp protease adaptor protein ClpS